MTNFQRRIIAFYLIFSVPISGATTDIFVPSLPAITTFFNVDKTFSQLSISIYLLGYALFSLIICPCSDAVGRKRPLMLGIILYIIVSYTITLSQSIDIFLILRFLQGISIACIIGITRAITPEVFHGIEYRKVSNKNTIAWSIGPIVSPFIGGWLQHYLNWHWSFYVLTGYGILILLLNIFCLPETLPNKKPISIRLISQQVRQIMTNSVFIASSFICALILGSIMVFNTVGPFLIQTILGYSAAFYGVMALIMGLAFFIGNSINNSMINHPPQSRIKRAILIALITAKIEVILIFSIPMSIYTIMVPTFIILICAGIIFPNPYSRALSLFSDFSGTTSAVFSTFYILVTSIISGIASMLHSHNQIGFSLMYLSIVILMTLSYLVFFLERGSDNKKL